MKNKLKLLVASLFISPILFLACSNGDDNAEKELNTETKIEKEYYENGQLKSLKYYFKNDDLKVIGFMPNGTLSHIHNISNNNNDNFMITFDGNGNLWTVTPFKNNSKEGKALIFNNGKITHEDNFENDTLIK